MGSVAGMCVVCILPVISSLDVIPNRERAYDPTAESFKHDVSMCSSSAIFPV